MALHEKIWRVVCLYKCERPGGETGMYPPHPEEVEPVTSY